MAFNATVIDSWEDWGNPVVQVQTSLNQNNLHKQIEIPEKSKKEMELEKKKNLVKNLMGQQIQLNEKTWNQINMTSAIFFGGLGALNLYVAFNFSESTWVNFKLFGITGLIICYAIMIGILASRANHK